MKKIAYLCLISFSFSFLFSMEVNKFDTWLLPKPEQQLVDEGRDDIKGVGRLFMPAMINPDYEPFYSVYNRDGNEVHSARMGVSAFLKPGIYIVEYGSGSREQMIRQEVQVYKEHTTIPDINWAGVIFRIIDENRTFLNSRFEIFDLNNGDSFGFGYGVDEDLGEVPNVWILKPGKYKITLNGMTFNTYIDFTTIDLDAGEFLELTIVQDSETAHLIGAGIVSPEETLYKRGKTRFSSALHGNANFSSDNSTDKNNPTTTVSFITQLDNRFIVDDFPFYYSMKNLFELGFTKDTETEFRITTDDFNLKNTFIYYFSSIIGTYSRFDANTHFFTEKVYYSEKVNIIKLDSSENTVSSEMNTDNVKVKPSFFPASLKEGLGVNLRLMNSPSANLNIRSGLGLRQDVYKDVYAFEKTITDSIDNSFTYDVYKEVESTNQTGIELSLIGNFLLFNKVNYTTNADVLFPFKKDVSESYLWENVFNLRLLKYLSFDYKLNFDYNKDVTDYIVVDHSLFLRLTYFLR